ncbi:MAG: hypothetical protein WBB26_01580 [Saprospiraceae bacterium]|jgi:hypothetical protein
MKRIILILLLIQAESLSSQECKRLPSFIQGLGFDLKRTAFSTSEPKHRGVVLIEFEDPQDQYSKRTKFYQDTNWLMTGYAGAITTDNIGNTFVLPKSNVNMLFNKAEDQNTIYCINGNNGKMGEYLRLPIPKLPNKENAYGLMGSFFDCENNALIVSTIAGSDSKLEFGKVYMVHTKDKTYQLLLDSVDVLGMAIGNLRGKRHLVYGLCRVSQIWSVELNAHNNVISKPRMEIDLNMLGPRGDDKARRIRFQKDGSLDIFGVSFFYNLFSPTVKPETVYNFKINPHTGNFELFSLQ